MEQFNKLTPSEHEKRSIKPELSNESSGISASQRIHEFLGKCWHEESKLTFIGKGFDGYAKCECGRTSISVDAYGLSVDDRPFYTTDLNATMEVVNALRKKWYDRDPDETLFFRITDCGKYGWRVDVEWGHHDGDIPVKHEIGNNLAETLATLCVKMIEKERLLEDE